MLLNRLRGKRIEWTAAETAEKRSATTRVSATVGMPTTALLSRGTSTAAEMKKHCGRQKIIGFFRNP